MDVIVKGVLSFIQQEKKYAMIAGGAVRDSIFKVEPKDYDIFVPISSKAEGLTILGNVVKEFGNKKLINKTREYNSTSPMTELASVSELQVEGRTFDFIFAHHEDDDEFSNNVLKTFDYGVNMVCHDGNYLDDTNEHFIRDRGYGEMTLHNMKGMSSLPKMMEKFTRINQKLGGGWIFRSTCLKLLTEKEPERQKDAKKPWTLEFPQQEEPIPVHPQPAMPLQAQDVQLEALLNQINNQAQ